jgi:hypothetical protein
MDPIPYANPLPPKRHPLRVGAGLVGLVLGSLAILFVSASYFLVIVKDDSWRAEQFAGPAMILAVLGAFASPWNLPRLVSIIGLSLSAASMLALYLITKL